MAATDGILPRSVHRDGAAEDEFAGRETAMTRYAERSAGRFAASLEALESLRAGLPREPRVLELGADPWLFTQLLSERGLTPVTAGQRPGVWTRDETLPPVQRIELRWARGATELEHHLFDAERERWPFGDGAFDLVVCMEVIEHLTVSPAHVLHEANRVLVPGGRLLVTTPNAIAATKLALMLRGRPVGYPYSMFGATGRHNREFTAGELAAILSEANLTAEVTARNVAGYEPGEPLGRALRAIARARPSRRDHLFAVARKTGPPRLAFPDWLYRDVDPERMRRGGVELV